MNKGAIIQMMEKTAPEAILKKYRSVVWPVVESYLHTPVFPQAFKIKSKYRPEEKEYWRIVSDYPHRKGKYLRPTLVCLTAEAMGANLRKALLTAAAMQISEEWLLIHDDLEDNSLRRRGLPALHCLYDVPSAINAGDGLQNVMWKVLADNRKILGEKTTFRLLDEFYIQLSRTILGQMTEIRWSKSNKIYFSDSDWYFIADGKTSYYTIACPMRLGAIIGGASQDKLEKLALFGVFLGRAFQLTDDILDVTGDFGGRKEFGGDIYEGKVTILLGHLLKEANAKDKKRLILILEKKREEKTKEEVWWVAEKMREYGAVDYAQKLALQWKDKAKKYFNEELTFLSQNPYRSSLLALIDFITNRNY